MSSFKLQCDSCFKTLEVSASQAGGALDCDCGKKVPVPRLSQLRESAGLKAFKSTASDKIDAMVKAGELPAEADCIECHRACRTKSFMAICHMQGRTSFKERPSFMGGFILGIPFLIPVPKDEVERDPGSNVVVPVPLRICDACWARLQRGVVAPTTRALWFCAALAAVTLSLLWLLEPVTRINIPLHWPAMSVAVAFIAYLLRRYSQVRGLQERVNTFKRVPVYAELWQDYPHAEIQEA